MKSNPEEFNKKPLFMDESPLPAKKRKTKEHVSSEPMRGSPSKKKQKVPVEESSKLEDKANVKREKKAMKESKSEKEEIKEQKEEEKKVVKSEASTPNVEKKKSYFAYKAREGPRNLGTKEIPQVDLN